MANNKKRKTGTPTEPISAEGEFVMDDTVLQLEMSKDYWSERYDNNRGVWYSYRLGDFYRDSYKQLERK